MHDSELDRLERYRASLWWAWRQNGDANAWPIKLNAAMHLFAPQFGQEVVDALERLEANGCSLEQIAERFTNPSRVFRMIDYTVYSMRRGRYSLQQQRAVVLKLLSIVRHLKYGSEFNDNGQNIVCDPGAAAALAARLQHANCSPSDGRVVHRLCAALWAYSEAVCFRAHDLTKEFHGPYGDGDGGRGLVVKDYFNLRPIELWADVPLLPCQTIRVVKRYRAPLRLRIEWHNRMYHSGGSLADSLTACVVEVDGVIRGPSTLHELIASAQVAIAAISRRIDAMPWCERVEKYAELFWLRKKPLSDLCDDDWHVPGRVREVIRAGGEYEPRRRPLSPDACERLAALTI